jgi:hypothetical protein
MSLEERVTCRGLPTEKKTLQSPLCKNIISHLPLQMEISLNLDRFPASLTLSADPVLFVSNHS